MANRVMFLVDGFNIYHSVRDIMRNNAGWSGLKWLNLDALCGSMLSTIGKDAKVEGVHYFTALAHHRVADDKTAVQRHETYISAFEATGVVVHRGQFKPKDITCRICGQASVHHEEKETDVAIATTLLELLHQGACDTAVLISGDTDLSPALMAAARLFPTVQLVAGFPYGRAPKQLRKLVSKSFKLRKETYRASLFSEIIIRADGTTLARPAEWAAGHQARRHKWGRWSWPIRQGVIRVLCALIRWVKG